MRSPGKGNLPQEQQEIIIDRDLSVYDSAFLDIKICVVCMCVQRSDLPESGDGKSNYQNMGHFSRFQNLEVILHYRELAFLDIKICQKITKYIHCLISNNNKQYQINHFLISEYEVIREGRGIQW